jgi:hypothetical protein
MGNGRGSSRFTKRAGAGSDWLSMSRAGEWWEHKLVPIIALFYAAAASAGTAILAGAPSLLLLLGALVPGAVFVSIVNDLTDVEEDAVAGKVNYMRGRSRGFAAFALGVPLIAGLAFAWLWSDDPPLLLAYLAAWLAFALYSARPFRLKGRGWAGAVADAAGANLFPALVAVLLAFRAAEAAIDPLFVAAAGIWAFAFGMRGIIRHQLADLEADRTAEISTVAQREPKSRLLAVGRFVLFPAEIAALAVVLWRAGDPTPLLGLLLYAALLDRRAAVFRLVPVILDPRPRSVILMDEYYSLFLPLALLAGSALRHPGDLAILAAHLLVFPAGALRALRDGWRLRYA